MIGGVHVILAFLVVLLLLLKAALKMAVGTGTDASLVAQRLLTIATPKQVHNHIHTCKQEKTLRNNTTVHKNSKQK